MQANVPSWLSQWLVEPALVLGGTGVFARLVLWPALKSYMRSDMKPELAQIAETARDLRDLTARTVAVERSVEALKDVPVMLARIETKVDILAERRTHDEPDAPRRRAGES